MLVLSRTAWYLATGGCVGGSVRGALVDFALGSPRVRRWCTNGLPYWLLLDLPCHSTPVLKTPACWMIDGSSCRGSSRVVANQRLPASCMNLYQLQPMESVCTLLHGAAGVRMCLFYMQCMSCCWSLFLLERSGGTMTVCLKIGCSGRVCHRGCTCEGDVGFYFSFLT